MNNVVEDREIPQESQSAEATRLEVQDAHLNVRVKEEPETEQDTTTCIGENTEVRSNQSDKDNVEYPHHDMSNDDNSTSNLFTRRIKSEPRNECEIRDNNAEAASSNNETQITETTQISTDCTVNAENAEEVASAGEEATADDQNCPANTDRTDKQPPMDDCLEETDSNTPTVEVKSEPQCNIPEAIPDDFFEDLLNNADQLAAELSPPTMSDAEQNVDEEVNNSFAAPSAHDTHSALNNESSIKSEPLNYCESLELPIGDENDNISTPPASPQRSVASEISTERNLAQGQVFIKSEINSEVDRAGTDEAIPANFFDDLLHDSVAERVARIRDECEDIKYSEKLKEIREQLRQLDEQEDEQSHDAINNSSSHKHKSKKSKKKSRKRARSRERRRESEEVLDNSESRHGVSKRRHCQSNTLEREVLDIHPPQMNTNYGRLAKVAPPNVYNQSRSTARSALEETPDIEMLYPAPIMVKPEFCINLDGSPLNENVDNDEFDLELQCLPVQTSNKRTITDCSVNIPGFKKIKLEKNVPEVPAEPLILTPAMKRRKALQMATETIQQFHRSKLQTPFYFASSVRKLPTSSSYVTQQSYENRSPLHTIHNVRFAFNSPSTRLHLRDWGLEALPKVAAKVARIVGCDADTLFNKLQAAQLSKKYIKIKREQPDCGETIDEIKSSFYTNAMTQTDDVYVLSARRRNANDIGVQAAPVSGNVATQTTDTSSSMSASNADLPIMQLINVLNENQLLALNDFAELIREPADTALDMYRLRSRMLEIYKCSQLPSAMAERPDAVTARIEEPPIRIGNTIPPQNHVQQRPNARDPRSLTFGGPVYYRNDLRAPFDPRLQTLPPHHSQLHPPGNNAPTKYYGRGSVRR